MLKKIELVKEFILDSQRNERTEELITYLNEIKLEVDGKRYGLVFDDKFIDKTETFR